MSTNDAVDELRDRVDQLEARVDELEDQAESGGLVIEGTEMREFVNEKNPTSHIERATAIGYFLEQGEGYDSFTVNDIENGYVECKISLPANMSDVLAGAANRDDAWMMQIDEDADGRYLWTLTQDGEAAVEDNFNQ